MRLYQEMARVTRDAAGDRIARLEQLIAEGAKCAPAEDVSASTDDARSADPGGDAGPGSGHSHA
jgi:hypothetical protein